jgi:hypothetical protein
MPLAASPAAPRLVCHRSKAPKPNSAMPLADSQGMRKRINQVALFQHNNAMPLGDFLDKVVERESFPADHQSHPMFPKNNFSLILP